MGPNSFQWELKGLSPMINMYQAHLYIHIHISINMYIHFVFIHSISSYRSLSLYTCGSNYLQFSRFDPLIKG